MYLFENSVLQRELLLNLRRKRAFLLLLGYLGVLGMVVYFAWPQVKQVDLMNPVASQPLVNLFFAAQFLLVSLLPPRPRRRWTHGAPLISTTRPSPPRRRRFTTASPSRAARGFPGCRTSTAASS